MLETLIQTLASAWGSLWAGTQRELMGFSGEDLMIFVGSSHVVRSNTPNLDMAQNSFFMCLDMAQKLFFFLRNIFRIGGLLLGKIHIHSLPVFAGCMADPGYGNPAQF